MDLEALRAAVVSARERAAGDESRLPDLGWAIYAYCLELRNHQDPLTNASWRSWRRGSACCGDCSAATRVSSVLSG
jgi:hypothetical protein